MTRDTVSIAAEWAQSSRAIGVKAMTSKLKLLVACSSVPLVMLVSAPAFAAGTPQATPIANTVNVNYQVGGVAQTQQSSTDTFVVDRKILFTTVQAAATGTTVVNPGSSAQVTRFQVTNSSNDTLDFLLAGANQTTAAATANGGTDAFDVTGLTVFVDNVSGGGTVGVYDPGIDTATTIDDLIADASRFVFVLGNIPLAQTNGQVAGVTLTATARNSAGTAITAATDLTVNGANTVETIFADAAKTGIGGVSVARDGIDVATDDYTVSAAVLSVFKSSRIVFDNLNGPNTNGDATNPKSVPGATVEYCISVSNGAGGALATNINISDLVPTNTTYVASSIRINTTVTNPGLATQTCGTGSAGGTFGSGTVSGSLTDLSGGQSLGLAFRATIN